MEIRVGVMYTPKEIEIDLGDEVDREEVLDTIQKTMSSDEPMLWLTDRRGRRVGVPTDKVAYVEVGAEPGERRVGFSAL